MKLTIFYRHLIDIYRLAQIYAASVDVEIKSFETSPEMIQNGDSQRRKVIEVNVC